jgi:hypothetical protein
MSTNDNIDTRQLIASLRGGIPDQCSWCGDTVSPDDLEPEEAGDWVCQRCLQHTTQRAKTSG